nr:hypothetical protein [uncultured Draconibacterium sp.]
MGKALLQATTGLTDNQLKKTSNFFKQNTAEMKKAAALSDKIYQTDLKERKQTVERAKVEKQIAELKLKSRESELTNVTASIQYLKQAQALEDELLKTDLEIAKARKEIQVEKNTYARSNTENLNAEAELIAKVSQVERTRLDQQAATQRRLNSLQRQQIAQFKAERKEIEKTTDGFKELIGNGQGKPVEIPVKPKLETDKLKS